MLKTIASYCGASIFKLSLFLWLLATFASPAEAATLTIRNAWVRGTVSGQHVTSAYMTIDTPIAAVITSARSPIAAKIELRDMEIADKGPLQPKIVDSIHVPAGESLRLTPLTSHLMLTGLKQPLGATDSVQLIVQYRLATGEQGEIAIDAPVRPFFAKPSK